MFLYEPPRTDYDLHFSVAGFPVRVHPFFWLAGLFLGASGSWQPGEPVDPEAGMKLLLWIVVMFVSILIHELGHAFVIQYFGQAARIVLYMFGGLAITDSTSFPFSQPSRRTPGSQIMISLAGPGAEFVLAALCVAFIYALGGSFWIDSRAFPFFDYRIPPGTSRALEILIFYFLYVNIFWAIMNLLPVFPLDGGQVSRELFELADPRNGFVRALWLSIITAAVIAVAGWVYLHSRFMPLLFASLAISNYMTLQQIRGGGFGGRPW